MKVRHLLKAVSIENGLVWLSCEHESTLPVFRLQNSGAIFVRVRLLEFARREPVCKSWKATDPGPAFDDEAPVAHRRASCSCMSIDQRDDLEVLHFVSTATSRNNMACSLSGSGV